MGAWTQSLAIQSRDRTEVRQTIINWMLAKGFVLNSEPRLFRCDDERERGVYLFSNAAWSIVLYSQKFDELERLVFELKKLNRRLLFLSCFDSDEWGYRLFSGREMVDKYLVNTHYFVWPPDTRQHAATLCECLAIPEQVAEITRILRKRAVFSETVLQRFCESLNIVPAGLGYEDIDSVVLGFSGVWDIVGFQSEHLFFVRQNAREALFPLHSFTVTSVTSSNHGAMPVPPELEEWDNHARTQMHLIQLLLWPLRLIIYGFGWLAWLGLWLNGTLRRRGKRGEPTWGDGRLSTFLSELAKLQTSQRVDEGWLVNDRYACRIALPSNAVPHESRVLMSDDIFSLAINGNNVRGRAVRPSELSPLFIQSQFHSIVRDESFFVGLFPARLMIFECANHPQGSVFTANCILEGARTYYRFTITSTHELSEASAETLRALVSTFQSLMP